MTVATWRRIGRARWIAPGLLALAALGCGPRGLPVAERLAVPAGSGTSLPHLATAADGAPVLSWVTVDASAARLEFSVLRGDTWSPPRTVATGPDWFVNWADYPSVVPISSRLWAAHWLVKRAGGPYAYDVAVSVSADAGATWSAAVTPHRDGLPVEHGFVSLFPAPGGVGVVWLDGRNTAADPPGPMALRSAVIDEDLGLGGAALVDDGVCDCCQTDVAAVDDGVVAVYRDRTGDEIRDVSAARLTTRGWQRPAPVVRDGWLITGCPVNGPAVAGSGRTLVVGWYTEAQANARVQLARSVDGGRTFGAPVVVDGDGPFGRVSVALFDDFTAAVAWLRPAGRGEAELAVAAVTADGTVSDPLPVAVTGSGRPSGFPQIVAVGDHLILAWTDTADREPVVRAARVARAGLRRSGRFAGGISARVESGGYGGGK